MEAEKLFLLFSLVVLQFSSCTSQDSLKTSQTIKEGDLLISKGNNFALGFFSPGSSSNRYLGIWYHEVPEKTVVWVANRNDPIIGSSGSLFINRYGNLVLYGHDDQKLPVWFTNVSVEENDSCEAQLLDSGNLIIVTKRSRSILWQSFDHPTNTLLPGMKIGLDRKLGIDRFLTSWRSSSDPSVGNFSAGINPLGIPEFFMWYNGDPLWRSGPWVGQKFIGIPGMSTNVSLSGFSLQDKGGGTYKESNSVSTNYSSYSICSSTKSSVSRFKSSCSNLNFVQLIFQLIE